MNDKDLAHLVLVLATLTVGRSRLEGLGDDITLRATSAALRAFGARIEALGAGAWVVDGVGIGGLAEPAAVIDLSDTGPGATLLVALAASHPVTTVFSGGPVPSQSWHDLAAALEGYGAGFVGRAGMRPPITVVGATDPLPAIHPAADEAGWLALLVAGLNTAGRTVVTSSFVPSSRVDAVFAAFGAPLRRETAAAEELRTSVEGWHELSPVTLRLSGHAGVVATGTDI